MCVGLTAFAAELRIGQATNLPGATVSVPVIVSGASGAVAAQFDVSFIPSVVSLVRISPGDNLAGHVVDQQQLAPGHWRVLAYSTTNGPIAPGEMVWLSFHIPTNAPDGIVPLGMTNAIVAQVAGQRMQPLAQISGSLTVWSGGSFLSLTLTNGSHLQMQFQGAEGRQYAFEASTNLTDWVRLSTNTVVGGIVNLPETNISAYSQRFYRAVLLP